MSTLTSTPVKPPGARPPAGASDRAPAAGSPSIPLLVGDLSYGLIGLTGVLTVIAALAAAFLVGSLAGEDANLSWFTTRGSGIAAYLLMVGVMVYGLLLSARSSSGELPAPVSYGMHDYLSWLSLGFTVLHMAVLLFDRYLPFTVATLLTPGASTYEPLWVGAGQIGLYLSLIVTVSIYFKKRAQRLWRALHYASFVAFVLITLHGLNSGSDSKLVVMQAVYGLSLAGIVGLTLYRIVAARRHRAGS
jgi:predicted ferric reductase